MPAEAYLYCDVSLPVPLDQAFTYSVPEALRHRIQPGCRVTVSFGKRRLTGVVLRCHTETPEFQVKPVLRLVDPAPVLEEDLLELGRWIADYYCAPLGEVLRAMTPLASEIRQAKRYVLTPAGQQAVRQLLLDVPSEDPELQILHLLAERSYSAAYLKTKVPLAAKVLKALHRRGLVTFETVHAQRDPLRSPSHLLRLAAAVRPEGVKLSKAERELLAYLELHPGSHNLKQIEQSVKNAGAAARSLARKGYVTLVEERPTVTPLAPSVRHALNAHQQEALHAIVRTLKQGVFHTYLLFGVTGSGKTEVYLRAIEAALKMGRGALMLVPEIALTPAVAGHFYQRFGERVAILHSALSGPERANQWRRIHSGDASVVVGTRSGVFAAVRNLGLVVVDEEHDASYKQDETPRYNGRDVAIVRAQAAGACVVLGSATPSMESRYNAERGKYTLLELPQRVEDRPLPQVELIDMRAEFLETRKLATFSRRLRAEIQARLERGEQAMLLLNRRGFANFLACRACGERLQCVNCSVTLTFHRRDRRMLCHYCNYAVPPPKLCPSCQSEYLYFAGAGSERVEDELHALFPKARIARLDRDTTAGKRNYETILRGFRLGHFDILVGTQMIAKGHDIPNVTLVGVVNADIGLSLPDFRAAERTFQLLTQVAGRAGRGQTPGLVLLQTLEPGHYAVRFAAAQDYRAFYARELQFRRSLRYPPFSALANLLVRDEDQAAAAEMCAAIGRLLTPPPEGMRVLGPAEAPVARVEKEYRYQILIKAAGRKPLQDVLRRVRQFALESKWNPTALIIDVDPVSLL
ncbi:MAG: primosomal protein N' [Bryobacteraceae bacterium]